MWSEYCCADSVALVAIRQRAPDPPVCANDLCRDKAHPFKHADVDVCYNAQGYEGAYTRPGP